VAKKSALHINKGVEDAPSINPNFRPKAIKSLGPEDLLRGILAGNLAALSKAITMVESTSEKDVQLLVFCFKVLCLIQVGQRASVLVVCLVSGKVLF